MVRLSLPLRDPFDIDYKDTPLTTPGCDSTQLIYNNTHCVTSFHFCSDSNPCPSGLPCIDRVCQCLPSKHQYITLAPSPVRMYTAGCNYEKPKVSSCSKYEYGVDGVCLLNYCSEEMPCYAGKCELALNSCVNITAARKPLPVAVNQVIDFGDDPFGLQRTKFTLTPLMIVLIVAGGIVGLAIVGCLIRTTLFGITSSVRWASKGQRLADGDEKYESKDKDSCGNPSLDVKLPMAFSSEPRVNSIQTPTNSNGAHYIPPKPLTFSNEPSPYSTPAPSPQTSTFAPIETCAIQSGQSGHSGQSQKSTETESSIEIEIEDIGDKLNVKGCNEKQCNQPYIDYYAACQCRRITVGFYEHSKNVEGLIRRRGGGFTNPYGDSSQYRPDEGTAAFSKIVDGPVATFIYDGTTYYGGNTGIVSSTTRIVSAYSHCIISGTSTRRTRASRTGTPIPVPSGTGSLTRTGSVIETVIPPSSTVVRTPTRTGGNGPTTTVLPIMAPSESPVPISTQGKHISGGAIAGIVLGILGATLLAGLLALCWRRKRAAHVAAHSSTHIAHGPNRTTVVEKIEPAVVKSVPAGETYHASSVPVASADTAGASGSTTYNTQTRG
ncbi:hypothetical protein CPB97_004359 [Podila verticillata]|nr:hypothetical protein CPB97_004359 [Podila verticillata]